MKTKEEIIERLMDYLDLAIVQGFFTEEEVKEINALEREYDIQLIEERE